MSPDCSRVPESPHPQDPWRKIKDILSANTQFHCAPKPWGQGPEYTNFPHMQLATSLSIPHEKSWRSLVLPSQGTHRLPRSKQRESSCSAKSQLAVRNWSHRSASTPVNQDSVEEVGLQNLTHSPFPSKGRQAVSIASRKFQVM